MPRWPVKQPLDPKRTAAYFSALDGPTFLRRLLRVLHPAFVLSRLARYLPDRYLPTQIYLDSLRRPAYAYGLYVAALQAKVLDYSEISAIEFGVAKGHGLLALEALAGKIGAYFGLAIQVHGFDSGEGLPRPQSYRDHPYLWREGDFSMDVESLRSRLHSAKLWLGPVAETLPDYGRELSAPVGFVSFDLDFYSSTVEALRLFDLSSETRLPRVLCYFDDIVGPDYAFYTKSAGELLAIEEFNAAHPEMAISPLRVLTQLKPFRDAWHAQMYALHDFNHPRYKDDFYPEAGRQFGSL